MHFAPTTAWMLRRGVVRWGEGGGAEMAPAPPYGIKGIRIQIIQTNKQIPYARHYNPRFVYFLPHFSVRFIIKSG
jgi:hypothetical protein